MVVGPDGVAESRVVETGIHDGDLVQITKGLSGGETIVANGAYGLPDKTHVKLAEASAPAPNSEATKPEAEKE